MVEEIEQIPEEEYELDPEVLARDAEEVYKGLFLIIISI